MQKCLQVAQLNMRIPVLLIMLNTLAFSKGEANEFRLFTSLPVHTWPQQPELNGRYLANSAMLRALGVPHSHPSTSGSRPATERSTVALGLNENGGRGAARVGVDSSSEDPAPPVVENEAYNDQTGNGRRRMANALDVISATEIIIPTMEPNTGVAGWIAVGVLLPLVFLFVVLLLIFGSIQRRRVKSTRVKLTSTIPVTQYDARAGTRPEVSSSRYRTAWDNLQVHVQNDKNANVGKDTLTSDRTLQSTWPRRRDDIAVKSGSVLTASPSPAGAVNSIGTIKSLGGPSEACHSSEKIWIDGSQAAPQHLPFSQTAGNICNPYVIEVIPSTIPRTQAV